MVKRETEEAERAGIVVGAAEGEDDSLLLALGAMCIEVLLPAPHVAADCVEETRSCTPVLLVGDALAAPPVRCSSPSLAVEAAHKDSGDDEEDGELPEEDSNAYAACGSA